MKKHVKIKKIEEHKLGEIIELSNNNVIFVGKVGISLHQKKEDIDDICNSTIENIINTEIEDIFIEYINKRS